MNCRRVFLFLVTGAEATECYVKGQESSIVNLVRILTLSGLLSSKH